MPLTSYLTGTPRKITIQAGDTGSIPLIVPEILPLVGLDVLFQVRDSDDAIILSKTTPIGATIIDQTIYVNLLHTDMVGKSGLYEWECELTGGDDDVNITIGKGQFVLLEDKARPE